jgi:hypothetical protein
MAHKHHDIIDSTITSLLASLKKKIEDGSATAADTANFIKLVQESGYAWHAAQGDASTPNKPDLPSFEDEDEGPIPFSKAK